MSPAVGTAVAEPPGRICPTGSGSFSSGRNSTPVSPRARTRPGTPCSRAAPDSSCRRGRAAGWFRVWSARWRRRRTGRSSRQRWRAIGRPSRPPARGSNSWPPRCAGETGFRREAWCSPTNCSPTHAARCTTPPTPTSWTTRCARPCLPLPLPLTPPFPVPASGRVDLANAGRGASLPGDRVHCCERPRTGTDAQIQRGGAQGRARDARQWRSAPAGTAQPAQEPEHGGPQARLPGLAAGRTALAPTIRRRRRASASRAWPTHIAT